jgi:hypothetical protein
MRPLSALLAIATFSAGAGACGGSAARVAGSRFHTSSIAATSISPTGKTASSITQAQPPAHRSTQPYLNDGDQDGIGDEDGDNNSDIDNDAALDYKTDENGKYRDGDDADTLVYGQTAGATDRQAITAVVKRYYAAATAGDGQRACAMIIPSLVKAVPEDYGQLGPSYLRGGKTCQAVMARLFSHFHSELTAPVAVTGALVNGDHALALLGSARMPASYITLQRQRGGWTINALLGNALR